MARPKGLTIYYIRLVNEANLDEFDRKEHIKGLLKLFRVVGHEYLDMFPSREMIFFQPTFHDGPLKDFELRCFLLPGNKAGSRARRLGSSGLGPGGTTFSSERQGTVSEIYVSDAEDYTGNCRLIFHEFMHNKLKVGNEMHFDANYGFGLAREQVSSNTGMGHFTDDINATNARVMARALLDEVPQYTGP